MGKIRVHQLSSSLGMPNKELVSRLQELGFSVKTHSSTIDEDDARRALTSGGKPEEAKPESRNVRTVLRRRKNEEPEVEATTDPAVFEGQEQAVAPAPDEGGVEAPPVDVDFHAGLEELPDTESALASDPEAPDVPSDQDVPGEVAASEVLAAETVMQAGEGSAAEPSTSQRPVRAVSKVVRVIDADAIKARLAADGKEFKARPKPAGRFPQVRELHVVQDQFGRGPTMVDVTRDRGTSRKPTSGSRRGEQDWGASRRERLEQRAGARDLWRTPGKKRKATKRGAKTEITQMAAHKRIIDIQTTITVGDLAKQMATKAGDVLRKLMTMGMMVTINQTIDFDTAALIAAEFDYEVKNIAFEEHELLEAADVDPEDLEPRAAVVTIMGHVDHGKTSLLDAIRATSVVAGEAGGITQHIGAYSVELDSGRVTFLDTPGHEAFTAMRARGAQVTDVVVLVVAADDGVMPQTVEAVNHAKSAHVPIIVAVNKMDRPDANPDRVMQSLTEYGMVAEAWGGETLFVPVSAKEKTGIKELLEAILLQAEMLDLRASIKKPASGTIVEAQLDRGRGPLATVLIREGILRVGDSVVSGDFAGRVRAMYTDRGEAVDEAGPSLPVQVLGIAGVPNAGDEFNAVTDEKTAKLIAEHRAQRTREHELAQSSRVSLETFLQRSREDEALELKLIVKADVQGSVEAVTDALTRLSNNQVRVNIIHSAVGAISESDVNLAATSDAVIIGFGVRPDTKALQTSEQQKVDIKLYTIIYEAVDGVRAAMEGRLPSTTIEKYLGRAEIRQIFNVPKVGTVAGCSVIDGKLMRNARVRLLRDNVVVHEGRFVSLKRFKDDVREVAQGYECGAGIDGYNDLKPGDVIEAFELEEVATKLEAGGGSGEERTHAGA